MSTTVEITDAQRTLAAKHALEPTPRWVLDETTSIWRQAHPNYVGPAEDVMFTLRDREPLLLLGVADFIEDPREYEGWQEMFNQLLHRAFMIERRGFNLVLHRATSVSDRYVFVGGTTEYFWHSFERVGTTIEPGDEGAGFNVASLPNRDVPDKPYCNACGNSFVVGNSDCLESLASKNFF